jgi:membrane-bound lytic murein transglycosylase B
MGIETNFGTYVGKMDILSSLATLSYDKRRSAFFTKELITILQLVESGVIDHKILYGSWAGAFGYFQFMPSTIKEYAIDYDENNLIELKSTKDSFASAANYLSQIGWKKNQPCFIEITLKGNTPTKLLNTSAKKIHNKKTFGYLRKYISGNKEYNIDNELVGAIITPDKDIVLDSNNFKPAFIIFENYEKILQWNRSLRFGLAVCTLKNKFKDLKKYISKNENYDINDNLIGAIITPDKDIVPNSENLKPAFIVFENYEKILQWNRSLRFALAVCTLKNKFENVL